MPKNTNIIGKYSSQINRNPDVSVYDQPEICIDLRVDYEDSETFKDETSISVLGYGGTVGFPIMFGASIDTSIEDSDFIFADTFGNEGKGNISFSTNQLTLILQITKIEDENLLPYYKEYELYKIQ